MLFSTVKLFRWEKREGGLGKKQVLEKVKNAGGKQIYQAVDPLSQLGQRARPSSEVAAAVAMAVLYREVRKEMREGK